MALNELVFQLGLRSAEFSADIKEAQQQIKALQQKAKQADDFVSSLGGNMLSAAKKFAGFAGAGLAAKEGLEKFLRAGQTTSDWMDRKMAGWSGLFDEFFRSLNNGSVVGFLSNMGAIKTALEEATRAADDFADARASLDVMSAKYNVQQLAILEKIKRNKDNPEIVAQLTAELQALEEARKLDLAGVVEQKKTAFGAMLNSTFTTPMSAGVAGLGDVSLRKIIGKGATTLDEIMSIFRAETLGTFGAALEQAQKIAATGWSTKREFTTDIHGNAYWNEVRAETSILSDKVIDDFKKQWGFSIAEALKYGELTDNLRESIRGSAKELYALLASEFQFNERNTEIFNIGKKTVGGAGGGVGAATYAEGSLGYYDKLITGKRKELLAANDAAVIGAISKEIERLEYARKRLLFEARNASPGATGALSGYAGIGSAITPIDKNAITVPQKTMQVFAELKQVNPYQGAVDGLSSLSQLMSSFSGIMKEGTAAWLNWASSALDSLRAVFLALQSTTMAGSASSAAAAGPFAWLAIPAAIASAVAAFASIPKFASGGIVGGHSYSGDKVLARVNSGEMILNQAQQARLWGKLNGGGASQVEFVIRGSELVGAINNYNSRRKHIL